MFNHANTYQALPLAGSIDRSMSVDGDTTKEAADRALEGAKYVGDTRGRGLFWAVESVKDTESKESFDASPDLGSKVQLRAFEMGVAM